MEHAEQPGIIYFSYFMGNQKFTCMNILAR